MLETPRYQVSGTEFLMQRQACVYAWTRHNRFLYIGSSLLGYQRLLNHHCIHRKHRIVKPDDVFMFWFYSSSIVRKKEEELIRAYRPLFNQTYKRGRCRQCNQTFAVTRFWARFCGTRCRVQIHNEQRQAGLKLLRGAP